MISEIEGGEQIAEKDMQLKAAVHSLHADRERFVFYLSLCRNGGNT